MRSLFFFGLLLLQLVPVSAGDHSPVNPLEGLHGPEKLRVLIETVVEHQHELKTLRAHFLQEKHSALLLKAVSSEGEFFFRAPDSVRWDYESPDRMTVLFSGTTLSTLRPDEKELEEVEISRKSRRFVKVLAGTLPLDELKSQFRMKLKETTNDTPFLILLTPTHRSISRKLKSISLEIDRRLFLPVRVAYEEADGDTTVYSFSELEVNPELEDRLFSIPREGLKIHSLQTAS